MDVSDTAQFFVLVREVDTELNATEEMLPIQPIKVTVTGQSIFQETDHLKSKKHISFCKLHVVSTCGNTCDGHNQY